MIIKFWASMRRKIDGILQCWGELALEEKLKFDLEIISLV